MTTVSTHHRVVPWWERAQAPWTGRIFDRAVLQPEDLGEQRIQQLREDIAHRPEGKSGYLSIERARLFTQSYRASEGDPPMLRRAKAIYHVFAHIGIPFPRYQLLAGSPAGVFQGAEVMPEFMTGWMLDEVEVDGRRMMELDAIPVRKQLSFVLREEDRRELLDDILPYWRERCHWSYVVKELERNFPESWHFARFSGVYLPQISAGLSHTIQDYVTVLWVGLRGLKAEIEEQLAELDDGPKSNPADFDRRNCYRAMLLCADGLMLYAQRCAEEAERLAVVESDAVRAEELREMARVCRKVPAGPAETWWEALQSFHFLHMAAGLGEGGVSHSAGRFDQYMLRYYRNELEWGTIDAKRAQELLECLFIKFCELRIVPSLRGSRGYAGMRTNDKITIGGTDRLGFDATNELSYRLLEAHAHVHLTDPAISVRLHKNTPDDLLQRALEVVRLGGGLPQLISDEVIQASLINRGGLTLEDARNFADVGCQENVSDPNMTGADTNGRNNAGWYTLPKPVELAMWNGVNPLTGVQAGPRTGDPRTFATMEQFLAAVRAQFEYAAAMVAIPNNVMDLCWATYYPMPLHDLLHPGPRRTGVDINAGGCRYNWSGGLGVGAGTAGDCLAAIDYLIYRHGRVTWDDLLQALADNWEGHEELRQQCISAPKYGADDEYADQFVKFVVDTWIESYARHPTVRGGHFVVGLISMGMYMVLGDLVGATPDGRPRGTALSDSTAASPFAPQRGPAAAHRSVARAIDTYQTLNGLTFNQKMSLTSVMSERDLSKWADLVRTYIGLGGQCVQYSVVNRQSLIEAQTNPDKYRDLIVRVGGYSATFIDLSREVQDYIIGMAEQQV